MQGEEHYIDQMFKDHFEDFEKSPSDVVWKGVVKEGTMANGKRFGLAGGWKSGATLVFSIMMCLMLLSGSNATSVMADEEYSEPLSDKQSVTFSLKSGNEVAHLQPATTKIRPQEVAQVELITAAEQVNDYSNPSVKPQTTESVSASEISNESITIEEMISPVSQVEDILDVSLMPNRELALQGSDWLLTAEAKRQLKHDLFATTYYKKPKGGHWFVTGGLVLDGSFGNGSGYADGLVFGAGKYINKNAFIQISLRGVWDYGFNMRATYTRLLLPGKIRPFVQAGLAWDDRLDLHVGAGIMYEPSPLKTWRIFASVNYENGREFFDRNPQVSAVLELGVQMRLSGTEPLISDNNWMNSVPHYKVPRGWYLEGSSNFAFFDKTKVTRISFYAGKNLNKRLFVRGGLRLGRDRVTLPVQLQYNAVVRQKLRFGVYGGPSLDVGQFRLGTELGLIAYYEVKPGWSLFVAPVILDNSQYRDRIFETGVRYYLSKKK